LREAAGLASVSVAASLVTLYGTGLLWHEVVEPGQAALAFVAGTLLVRAWGDRAGARRADAIARGGALGVALAGVALLAEVVTGLAPSLARPSLLDSLFSSRHGLFFWAPVLTIAVIGLALRAGRGHRAALGALTALAVLALVNSSLRPWWSGRFGNARFLPALPLFALGLAMVLDLVRTTAQRRPLRLAALAGGGARGLEPAPDGAVPRPAHPPRRHRLVPGRGREQREPAGGNGGRTHRLARELDLRGARGSALRAL
jgi:hypothetical protein